jgi:hypothetical protein
LVDGRTLVYQDLDYTKVVADGVARLIHPAAPIRISQILADDSVIGTEYGGTAALWRVDLKTVPLQPEKVRRIPWTDEGLSVSRDGQWLAFATSRNGPTQIWVSRLDGSNARVVIPAIPPFDRYGDSTQVDGVSWSPDGKWIAMGTEPGIEHGGSQGRIFIVPAAGGRLRKVVDCGSVGLAPVWTEDGKALYAAKYSEDFKASHFLVDIATGNLTPIAEEMVPKDPLVPLAEDSVQRNASQSGGFLYYEYRVEWEPRLVKVKGLVPK